MLCKDKTKKANKTTFCEKNNNVNKITKCACTLLIININRKKKERLKSRSFLNLMVSLS